MIGILGTLPFEEAIEVFTLEAEAAPVAELGGWNGALACPSTDRLFMHA